MEKIDSVDQYLAIGCMRCPLGNTPGCKVHTWHDVVRALRSIVLDCGLREEVKWNVPTYTFEGKNVLIVAAFKDYCGLNMFKGVLIKDPAGFLEAAGPNSQSGMVGRFRSLAAVIENEEAIRDIILQAIELEKSGTQVERKQPTVEDLPEELCAAFEADPQLASSYFSLTPGRQRSHIIFITGAKQSKTREARVEKCIPKIMAGQGMMEFTDRRPK